MTDDNGLSQRALLLEVREDVKLIRVELARKADLVDVKQLEVAIALKADRDRVHALESKSSAIDLASQAIGGLHEAVKQLTTRVDSHRAEIDELRSDARSERNVKRLWWSLVPVMALLVSGVTFLASHYH